MKILDTDLGWAVEHNGKVPIRVEGKEYFPHKDDLIEAIAKRKLFVWSNGAIEKDPEPPKRGRPRKFSEEEAKERRREKAREYSANRSEEQKAAARERSKRWRENNPDKVKEAREKSVKARADRYANDPEYRKQFNEYQREYKRGQRGKD